jgi:IMP dehydrogenase
MREIELASWKDILRRVGNVVKSLEMIYSVKLYVDLEEVSLEQVYPTEDFLENDKLALVFMKTVLENYDVPIIVVKKKEDYFILDGHHRSFVYKKLMIKSIRAYVLKFPEGKSYRDIFKHSIEDLRIKDISTIEDPILKAWQRILYILEHYEAIYDLPFYLKKENIALNDLVPTQSHVKKAQIDTIKEILVPIVCIHVHDKYYILDGHARSLRAEQLGLESIEAMILLAKANIDFGIIKTTEDMHLHDLADVQIIP